MIKRTTFINKLRELGYTYDDQTDRSQLWRKVGGTHEVWIKRKLDPVTDEYVRNVLRQCGLDEAPTEVFIVNNQCDHKAQ